MRLPDSQPSNDKWKWRITCKNVGTVRGHKEESSMARIAKTKDTWYIIVFKERMVKQT